MFRSVVFLLLIVFSLNALSTSQILRRADGFMRTNNKSNQFRAYNDYKNLYLQALMKEDSKLKLRALKGITKSGKKLHIDVSQYEDELKIFKQESIKRTTKIKHRSYKKIQVRSSHKLKSVRWENEKLVLKFDKKLSNKQLNYFSVYDAKRKLYRYIFDIHASMLQKSQKLKKMNIKSIKLSQHNSNSLRLLIENSTKLTISFRRELSKLIIGMNNTNYYVVKKRVQTAPKRLDRNKVIVIDAGHGGKDPGAIGYKHYREKVVVLKIAKYLNSILKNRGYRVYMTRDKDRFIKLSHRTKFANKKDADIFISIHANAVSKKDANKVQGLECYFLDKSRSSRAKRVAAKENKADLSDMDFYGKESFLNTINSHNIIASNKLAIDLQRGTLGLLDKYYTKVVDAGVRQGPFWVLVGAQMPSVLVEVGFITHPTEAKRLMSSKYQKRLATGLANGVERYFLNN